MVASSSILKWVFLFGKLPPVTISVKAKLTSLKASDNVGLSTRIPASAVCSKISRNLFTNKRLIKMVAGDGFEPSISGL